MSILEILPDSGTRGPGACQTSCLWMILMLRSALSCLWFLAVASPLWAVDPQPDPGGQLDYGREVLPLLNKYCGECHQGDQGQAGIAFDLLPENRAGTLDRNQWKKIHVQLANRIMPPVDEAQPTDEERAKIVAWINARAITVPCEGSTYPGRVTVRRLNRAEYNNTIRDLFGIDFQPASDFPADDTGYGFDNIGDVLTLPPVLLERYLEAAEQVSRRAIRAGDEDFITETVRDGRVLGSTDEVAHEFEFPVEGEYLLRIRTFADQAGDELAKMALRLDGQELDQYEVKAVRANESEVIEKRISISAGKRKVGAAFLNDYFKPLDKGAEDRNLHIVSIAVAGPIGKLAGEMPESHRRLMIATPSGPSDFAASAKTILKRLVPLAWRRPVEDAEIDRLVTLVQSVISDGGSFERGIQTAVQAVLVSPRFLFRLEQDPTGGPNPVRDLDNYELATRLSYFLWSSTPDETLLAVAAAGQLTQPTELERQTRRMLADPRSSAIVDNFASQWLQLRSLANVSPNPRRFPKFTKELRADMRRETEMFFDTILREDRSVLEFLSADYTFVNQRLAEHYGIEGVIGDEFRRVSVNADQRGGLLGQASILTVTSNPTRTSPVKRGKWILENLLAAPPPPAPANVPPLKESTRQAPIELSLKERMALHRSDPACAACHQLMDPLGFGLENYDATGVWRTNDGNADVDSTGDLPDGRKFNGPRELRTILLERADDFRRCFAERLLTYSLGRGLEYFDECAVRQIAESGKAHGDQASAFILAIVNSPAFRQRGHSAMPE